MVIALLNSLVLTSTLPASSMDTTSTLDHLYLSVFLINKLSILLTFACLSVVNMSLLWPRDRLNFNLNCLPSVTQCYVFCTKGWKQSGLYITQVPPCRQLLPTAARMGMLRAVLLAESFLVLMAMLSTLSQAKTTKVKEEPPVKGK